MKRSAPEEIQWTAWRVKVQKFCNGEQVMGALCEPYEVYRVAKYFNAHIQILQIYSL